MSVELRVKEVCIEKDMGRERGVWEIYYWGTRAVLFCNTFHI